MFFDKLFGIATACAESGAAALCSLLLKRKMTGGSGNIRYYTSGDPAVFAEAASLFLGCREEEIHAEAVPPQPIPEG